MEKSASILACACHKMLELSIFFCVVIIRFDRDQFEQVTHKYLRNNLFCFSLFFSERRETNGLYALLGRFKEILLFLRRQRQQQIFLRLLLIQIRNISPINVENQMLIYYSKENSCFKKMFLSKCL